jgi:hypothetical protein
VPPGYVSARVGRDEKTISASCQDFHVSVGSMHADALPILDHADEGGQAVLPGDHRAMGHQPAHLGH